MSSQKHPHSQKSLLQTHLTQEETDLTSCSVSSNLSHINPDREVTADPMVTGIPLCKLKHFSAVSGSLAMTCAACNMNFIQP